MNCRYMMCGSQRDPEDCGSVEETWSAVFQYCGCTDVYVVEGACPWTLLSSRHSQQQVAEVLAASRADFHMQQSRASFYPDPSSDH